MLMTATFFSAARLKRSRFFSRAILFSLVVFFLGGTAIFRRRHTERSLHLLVPATSSNIDLCRLLISTSVLGYGTPILINWAAQENEDAYVQHLAKVETILKYLDRLFSQGATDDLVLIVDGYDIQFQLPPEVMIQRYFQLNNAANERIQHQVGKSNKTLHDFKQTVIFGHDKLCWPIDFQRPACWAVPAATGSPYAFGPNTDQGYIHETSRARWLNSGTIMGPVGDVRDIFQGTLDLIHKNHTTDSDQFYFANLFALQEYSRRLFQASPFGDVEGIDVTWPIIETGDKAEYHLGLDYEGLLFQTMAFFRPYITWMTFDGTPNPSSLPPTGSQKILSLDIYHDKVLPDDVANGRLPHPGALGAHQSSSDNNTSKFPTTTSWKDLKLGMNSASNNIFPLLHFTGPKEFRELWWDRMWFAHHAEELLLASAQNVRRTIADNPIGGSIWKTANLEINETEWGDKGGAYGDNGAVLPWEALCGLHESTLFVR